MQDLQGVSLCPNVRHLPRGVERRIETALIGIIGITEEDVCNPLINFVRLKTPEQTLGIHSDAPVCEKTYKYF